LNQEAITYPPNGANGSIFVFISIADSTLAATNIHELKTEVMKNQIRVQEVGHTLSVPLSFRNINKAWLWYTHVFGAKENVRFTDNHNRIIYAELLIGDSMVFLTPASMNNDLPLLSSEDHRRRWLHIYVDNVDDTIDNAIDFGAFLAQPPANYSYGERCGCIIDPFGYNWVLAMHI